MKILTGEEERVAQAYLADATRHAHMRATCLRRRCGSIIVSGKTIIGKGHNSPPLDLEINRRCFSDKNSLHWKVTDKTCCVHAEIRALSMALRTSSTTIAGARLYFTSVDILGNELISGKPYCTLCSKQALDEGIGEWVLRHAEGITVYDAREYHELSLAYTE